MNASTLATATALSLSASTYAQTPFGWNATVSIQGETTGPTWGMSWAIGPWTFDPSSFFLGPEGVIYYNNSGVWPFHGQPPKTGSMSGSFGSTLVWQPGFEMAPSPTAIWVKLKSMAGWEQLAINGLVGNASASVNGETYSNLTNASGVSMQDRILKLDVTNGIVELPELSLVASNSPTTSTTWMTIGGGFEYTIYAPPILSLTSSPITYHKGANGERIPNAFDGNGYVEHDVAVDVFPNYAERRWDFSAIAGLSESQSILQNPIYWFFHDGSGASLIFPLGYLGESSNPNRTANLVFPSIPYGSYPDRLNANSRFYVEVADSVRQNYDIVFSQVKVSWHFPFENIQVTHNSEEYRHMETYDVDAPGYYEWVNGELRERSIYVAKYSVMTAAVYDHVARIVGVMFSLFEVPTDSLHRC